MWDGCWFLANRPAWEKLPADLRAIVARHIDAAGMNERADVTALNSSLQKDLADRGMVFNQARSDTFRDKLRSNGFYSEWKGKYGEEAWALLERYSGKLA